MAYIKIEINQARDRKVYYAGEICDLKISSKEPYINPWFDNEDCNGKSATKIPLPEIGEYRAHMYIMGPRDTSNRVEIAAHGPRARVIESPPDWSESTAKFLCSFVHLLSPPQFFRISLEAERDELFSCDGMAMILEQIV